MAARCSASPEFPQTDTKTKLLSTMDIICIMVDRFHGVIKEG